MKKIFVILILFYSTVSFSQNQWVIYTTQNSGLPSNMVGSILIDSNNVKWITTDNGFVKLQGNNWTIYDTINSGLPQNYCYGVTKDRKNILWLCTPGKGVLKYDGINWTLYNNENTGVPINWGGFIAFDNSNTKWFAGTGLIKYDDTNWVYYNTNNSGLPTNETMDVYIKDDIKWIGTYMGGVVRFDGQNWTVYNTSNSGLPSNWIYMVKSDLYNNLWFATFFGGVAKFNYNQNQWTVYNTTNSGLHDNNTFSIYIDNNNTKWIGANGLAIYNDTAWHIFPYPFIGDVFNFAKDRYGNMWICSAGGLYVYNPAGVVGVESNSTVINENYLLIKNYPNPFNATTKIKYKIPKSTNSQTSNVKLIIYNILGKEIETLVNEEQKTGEYEAVFNGSNLASGIYFVVLKADSKIKVHKIVLQK